MLSVGDFDIAQPKGFNVAQPPFFYFRKSKFDLVKSHNVVFLHA